VRLVVCAAFVLVLAAAGCGGDDGATWAGPPEADADGTVSVDEFNTYLDDVDEPWEGSATMAATEFLRLDERSVARTIVAAEASPEGTGPETVVVTLDGIADDSVRAERWTLRFEPDGEQYRLTSALREQRCQPERGHQDISPQPCL
jgi:hypothetical protein